MEVNRRSSSFQVGRVPVQSIEENGNLSFSLFSPNSKSARQAMCFHLDYQTLISIALLSFTPLSVRTHCLPACFFLYVWYREGNLLFLTRIAHVLRLPVALLTSQFEFIFIAFTSLLNYVPLPFFPLSFPLTRQSVFGFSFPPSCNITAKTFLILLLLCTRVASPASCNSIGESDQLPNFFNIKIIL